MASIGQELKRERELRGISLKEIADSTKISLRFLRYLEEDRLDNLPGKFLTKSIIRTYANYIGLDENAILNSYYESTALEEQSLEEKAKKEKPQTTIPPKIKKLIYFASLFAIVLAALSFILFILPKKETKSPAENFSAPVIFQEENPILSPAMEPEKEEKELKFKISFEQETWIQVYSDGELKLDGIKHPGDQIEITALKDLLIHTGNAGGFSFTLNDKKGKSFGSSGAVVKNIRISFDNIQQFLEQEENVQQ